MIGEPLRKGRLPFLFYRANSLYQAMESLLWLRAKPAEWKISKTLCEISTHIFQEEEAYDEFVNESRLRQGTFIWVLREIHYDVYRLRCDWDSTEMSREDFLNAICREVNL